MIRLCDHAGPVGLRRLVVIVFVSAFLLRLIALIGYADAPNFDDPIGDSKIYVDRAEQIRGGDLVGDDVYFHSSPIYAYFLAAGLLGKSFFALRLIQIVLGSLGCVAIALLARRLAADGFAAPLLAGLGAAAYGTLVFFDLDLLMIFLTVPLVVVSLLALLRAHERTSIADASLAGAALGLAATDKTNLLLFAPVAAWFLLSCFRLRADRTHWRISGVFVLTCVAMILPLTLRNLVVGDDLVLVSSNAGVNLYIGNNPEARGVFDLPAHSGLKNYDLEGSAAAVASRKAGRELSPSEVSRFWAGRAATFVTSHPTRAAALIGLKLERLFNAYEAPNHLNFYYMRTEFIPALRWTVIGAWLVFPLGLTGLCWRWLRGASAADRLLTAYLVTYVVSLLPFFVTARYRLPVVPVLVVYAALALVEIVPQRRAVKRWQAVVLASTLALSVFAAARPVVRFGYSFNQIAMATKHYDRALSNPEDSEIDIERTIVLLRWALETAPGSADARHNLGVVYEHVGFYSGAAEQFSRALDIEPDRTRSAAGLNGVRRKLTEVGDRTTTDELPRTPYERGFAAEAAADLDEAERIYRELLRRDPFHVPALDRLAMLLAADGRTGQAVALLERAVGFRPDVPALRNDLAGVYESDGDRERAIRTLEKCIELDPASLPCRRRLHAIETGER